MTEAAAPVKGTRPEGAVTEADASSKIREIFTQIAPRYDLLNHLLSLQLDRLWRARTASRLKSILVRPDALVLDLCCGTGHLEFAEPPEGLLGDFYRWYFCKILPKIGGLISGDQGAYKYLPNSVARFFRPSELASLIGAVGYDSVDYCVWTLGTVVLHTAVRPG